MKLNTIYLKDLNLPQRTPPRPKELRQETYNQQFEYDVLFYDIFSRDNKIFFIAPPLKETDLNTIIENIHIDNSRPPQESIKIRSTHRTLKIILEKYKNKDTLELFGNRIIPEERSHLNLGDRVFYTLQKNNDIQWIMDWVRINTQIHKPTGFIIYDNNSSLYTKDELQSHLDKIHPNVKIFNLPFRYGPGAWNGSSWDSDFLQHSLMEHVRYSFFSKKGFLANTDIDELIFGKNIFDYLQDSNSAVLKFKGHWAYIEKEKEKPISFASHTIKEIIRRCPYKWVADLSTLSDDAFLTAHEVTSITAIESDIHYTHFFSISNNWKYNRKIEKKFTSEDYENFDLSKYTTNT